MMSDYEQYPIFDTNPSQQSLHGRPAHGQMSPPTAYPYMFQQNLQHHQQLHSPPGSQISHISPIANTAFSLDPSQLRSSEVGPSRVTTRRQARMANRQASASHAFASQQHETQMGLQSGQNEVNYVLFSFRLSTLYSSSANRFNVNLVQLNFSPLRKSDRRAKT